MLSASLLILLLSHSAQASTPAEALVGDWDLGAESSALRITLRGPQNIFVQYCKRDVLLNSRVCEADVILYFNFSQDLQEFVHTDNGAEHLQASIQLDSSNSTLLHYSFKTDAGSGSYIGKKLD